MQKSHAEELRVKRYLEDFHVWFTQSPETKAKSRRETYRFRAKTKAELDANTFGVNLMAKRAARKEKSPEGTNLNSDTLSQLFRRTIYIKLITFMRYIFFAKGKVR